MAMASCALSESANSSPKFGRKPGRPSKVFLGEDEPLSVVTVEGKQDVVLTTRDDLKQCAIK